MRSLSSMASAGAFALICTITMPAAFAQDPTSEGDLPPIPDGPPPPRVLKHEVVGLSAGRTAVSGSRITVNYHVMDTASNPDFTWSLYLSYDHASGNEIKKLVERRVSGPEEIGSETFVLPPVPRPTTARLYFNATSHASKARLEPNGLESVTFQVLPPSGGGAPPPATPAPRPAPTPAPAPTAGDPAPDPVPTPDPTPAPVTSANHATANRAPVIKDLRLTPVVGGPGKKARLFWQGEDEDGDPLTITVTGDGIATIESSASSPVLIPVEESVKEEMVIALTVVLADGKGGSVFQGVDLVIRPPVQNSGLARNPAQPVPPDGWAIYPDAAGREDDAAQGHDTNTDREVYLPDGTMLLVPEYQLKIRGNNVTLPDGRRATLTAPRRSR